MPDTRIIFRLPNSQEIRILQGNWKELSLSDSAAYSEFYFGSFLANGSRLSLVNTGTSITETEFWQLPFYHRKANTNNTSLTQYPALVEKGVENLKSGKMEKVVLSASQTIPLPDTFQPAIFFHKLLKFYPSALVYCLSSEQTGTWFGASPEKLLSGKLNSLQTVALAGTLPNTAKSQWTAKEKTEQKLVEDFIATLLQNNQISYTKSEPATISAGNLMHLQTTFTLNQVLSHEQAVNLAMTLHPTPAIAGLPREDALQFIASHENHQRSFYSGIIGSTQKESVNLYVNLRCMEWHGAEATLYAGAGITKDSVPLAEWKEIQNKMKSLSQHF